VAEAGAVKLQESVGARWWLLDVRHGEGRTDGARVTRVAADPNGGRGTHVVCSGEAGPDRGRGGE
jgi:hypothetical protein